MKFIILIIYKKILRALYSLAQNIIKYIGPRLTKLSKEKNKANIAFSKNFIPVGYKLNKINYNYISYKKIKMKLLKFFHYTNKSYIKIFFSYINRLNFIGFFWKTEPSASILTKKFFRIFYFLGLVYLSFYFFLSGYGDYALFVKSPKNDSDNLVLYKNGTSLSKNFNNDLNTLPYSISKFKSGLKKFSWTLQKEETVLPEASQVAVLMKQMNEDNYDLDRISYTKEVPGFFVNELPKDISFLKDTEMRKKIFISIVLPHIVKTNRNIALKRNRLQKIYNKLENSKTLTLGEHNWLINLAAKYSIKTKHVHKIIIAESLLKHIDIIPNSIAIAQAAKESGWGTSRFAKEGNALFGQWTYDNSRGLLPTDRSSGQAHLVKSFDNIGDSVVSYMNNINSHRAYDAFRELRSELRNNSKSLDSILLVHELSSYAELPNYTQILQLIIEKNNLYIFDNIELVDKGSLV